MLRFTVRRLLLLVPILIGLSILVFVWIRALPGTPAEALLGERADEQSIAEIRDQLGLDDPFYVQYWRYVQTLAEGDLGTSIQSRRPITEELKERFEAFKRRSLYDIHVVASFLDATFICVRRSGPKEGVLVAW